MQLRVKYYLLFNTRETASCFTVCHTRGGSRILQKGGLPDQVWFQVYEKEVVNQAVGCSRFLKEWQLHYHLNGLHC